MLSTRQEAAPSAHHRRGHANLRAGPLALRLNVRVLLMALAALTLLAALATWVMTLGSFPIPFVSVVRSLAGFGAGEHAFIVRTLRLPRVLCAILTGVALALSGATFQGLVRNPLVSPDIIGINAGATVAAVFWIVTRRDASLVPVVAFAGALLAASVIYLLAWRGGIAGGRLVLTGIGVNAMLSAGTTFLMVRYPLARVSSAQLWSAGTLYGSDMADARALAAGLLVLAPLAVALTWTLRVAQVGDSAARAAGLPVERTRLALIATGCGLAAIAVAAAGPVGFVALMTPHIARMIAGPLSGSVMLLTGLIGALLVLAADAVGQHLLPVTLPVGVVTAAIGAPYFLVLLYRANLRM